MGLTKQYLRYEHSALFGVVGSVRANIVLLQQHGVLGRFCAVGACENIIVWDLRTEQRVIMLKGDKHEVSHLTPSPDKLHLAAGYSDGSVRIFNVQTGECTITFTGHKSAITVLQYDANGLLLVSGAKDTDVIVWDIVNESGLYRLKGHKGEITQARFLQGRKIIVTSSKDTFVKFWDCDTQHCFYTVVEHRSEVYDFVVLRNGCRLVTGSADSELRVFDITYTEDQFEVKTEDDVPAKRLKLSEAADSDDENDENILSCKKVGSVFRQGRERLVSMAADQTETSLVCHGHDHNVEVFRLATESQLQKLLLKRQKKARRKISTDNSEVEVPTSVMLDDEVKRLTSIKVSAARSKVRAFDLVSVADDHIQIIILLNNNSVESWRVDTADKTGTASVNCRLLLPGHRTDVRTVSFSSDNTAMLTASSDTVKIWNRDSLQCIRTMACDYALCSMFVPGDRHIILGTKSGKLQIFDISSAALLESQEAHTGAVWSVCMAPDKRGLISGSADHTIKFWDFELITDDKHSATSKRFTVQHTRTLKMDEDVLCVKYSPDHKFLAASLLDNTVKVFFADTLKFFLSLYGHKLPVLCMDISSDSMLLVTGSADRNVKIWGLDFGDCHKSIFAHDDSIMSVQFLPNTHLFFTGGKDAKLKQWDADKFEHITTLTGHHGEIWCLAVSSSGNFVVTGSHDKSLRLWEKTEELLVLEEEREMEREKEFEESMEKEGEPVVAGETSTEVGLAGKKTVDTVKAAERILEAVEVFEEETAKRKLHAQECARTKKELPAPDMHPMMLALNVKSPLQYVMEVIKKIKSSQLEKSLLVLPFSYVTQLIKILDQILKAGWETELTSRCLLFLLRVHHGQLTSNQVLLPVIDRLRTHIVSRVTELRDQIGFNLAGLEFLHKQVESAGEIKFFAEATDRFKDKKRKRKKKEILLIKT
ncbi:WD repeat-containing protein 3-like [Gigantopelta aegis]|uniref:WD repeat-containing protein 3-like n=1 Tax=Gigantopelta aegis TaxID=1735272 RepID=UPI001B888DDD|nr:WD repeat-containing protein 3-like [Gigantopelta aegis]XP_041353924.1 WD repeat-containing protein 3-like [Gigantopelta aegis]